MLSTTTLAQYSVFAADPSVRFTQPVSCATGSYAYAAFNMVFSVGLSGDWRVFGDDTIDVRGPTDLPVAPLIASGRPEQLDGTFEIVLEANNELILTGS